MITYDVEDILRSSKILLMGDFMLDVYAIGHVSRLSPEAPVPLLSVESEMHRPGGGGNAILNLLSLGMHVDAVGRVGNDEAGKIFAQMIAEPNVIYDGIICEEGYQTPIKKRMIAGDHQLLRVDYEKITPLSPESEALVKEYLVKKIGSVSIVAISDYGKGFFTPSLLDFTIKLANEAKVPVIIDPKGRDFSKYRGATLIKPNFSEAVAASGLSADYPLESIAKNIIEQTAIQTLMVTRGKEGISIFWNTGEVAHFPVTVHQVLDVTGAGDTVLAVITAAMANGVDVKKGAHLANIAASIAIECLGCARVTPEQIKHRSLG